MYILVYVLSQSSNPFCVSARICLNANISDIFQLKNSCSSNHSFLSLANGYEGEGQCTVKQDKQNWQTLKEKTKINSLILIITTWFPVKLKLPDLNECIVVYCNYILHLLWWLPITCWLDTFLSPLCVCVCVCVSSDISLGGEKVHKICRCPHTKDNTNPQIWICLCRTQNRFRVYCLMSLCYLISNCHKNRI